MSFKNILCWARRVCFSLPSKLEKMSKREIKRIVWKSGLFWRKFLTFVTRADFPNTRMKLMSKWCQKLLSNILRQSCFSFNSWCSRFFRRVQNNLPSWSEKRGRNIQIKSSFTVADAFSQTTSKCIGKKTRIWSQICCKVVVQPIRNIFLEIPWFKNSAHFKERKNEHWQLKDWYTLVNMLF